MPVVAVTASNPTKFNQVSFVIDWDQPNPLHFTCATRKLSHTVGQDFVDVETLCNPGGEAPGKVTQSLDVEFLWEHSTTGAWNQLYPLAGTRHSFASLLRGTGAVSASNPEISGSLWIPQVPFMDGTAVNDYMKIPLTFKISGIPLVKTTGSAVYAGHTAPA